MALEGERRAKVVLAACLRNPHYDRQCEENRAPYFMRLFELADLKERAREAILHALPLSEDEYDRDWMVDLLEVLAKDDPAAWEVLRGLATGGYVRAQNNLATTDEAGLRWVADNILPTLPEEDRWRVGMWLPEEESDDETPLQKSLRELDRTWDAERASRPRAKGELPPTARAFFRNLDDPKAPRVSDYGFHRIASRHDLREAAERLLTENDSRKAWRLSKAFRGRRPPLPLHRLFPHATHEKRGMAVCKILGEIDSPQVRHFARKLLRIRPLPWNAVEILTKSFRPGDEAMVAEVLDDAVAYDDEHRHSLVLDLVDLFREQPNASWQIHAEWVYEHSPCSMCRASAFDWLAEYGIVPIRFLEEAPYDAEPRIREAAEAFFRQK